MGLYDSYLTEDYTCPICKKENNGSFQTKELDCLMKCYDNTTQIDDSRRYILFYSYCKGKYNDKKCKSDIVWLKVDLDEKGFPIKEEIIMTDDKKEYKVREINYEK